MHDDRVLDAKRDNEMFVTGADDRARRANPDVLADERVARLIGADRAGEGLPATDVVPSKRRLDPTTG